MTDRPPRPGRGMPRRAATLAAVVAVIAVAVALASALGGGPAGSTPATAAPGTGPVASPAFSDLPLVTVAPTATRAPTASPLDTGSATPSPSPTPAAEGGIRANRIRIARLGIDLAIIEGDGIDAPIGKAAHFPGSAWPGGGSNIYIYGHARTGMFITLWQAGVGDTIDLDLVDGTARVYVVTTVLPKVPWDAVMYLKPTATEQLTVQTSTSYYPTAPRFVVIAVPAP
jgi:sortase (surface protein transpeptidase)